MTKYIQYGLDKWSDAVEGINDAILELERQLDYQDGFVEWLVREKLGGDLDSLVEEYQGARSAQEVSQSKWWENGLACYGPYIPPQLTSVRIESEHGSANQSEQSRIGLESDSRENRHEGSGEEKSPSESLVGTLESKDKILERIKKRRVTGYVYGMCEPQLYGSISHYIFRDARIDCKWVDSFRNCIFDNCQLLNKEGAMFVDCWFEDEIYDYNCTGHKEAYERALEEDDGMITNPYTGRKSFL